MKMAKTLTGCLAGAVLCAPMALASEIKWSGFMSVATGITLDDDDTYQVEPTTGGTYDKDFRFDPESLVGIQAQAIITDRLRGTVQMVAKGANDYDMTVDWAYLSYDITEKLALNAGRFRLPLFYFSDFLDVGYAYYWIRPPVEVYSTFTAALEGVNLYHSTYVGDLGIESQVWYGAIDAETEGGNFDTLNNQGLNAVFSYDWMKFRLLYNTTDIGVEFQIGDDVIVSELPVTFKAAAFMADYENFLFRSEYTLADTGTETSSWYVSAGYTLGDFTPHFTHAITDPDGDANTSSSTLGVAWNFHSSAVFKLEFTQSENETAEGMMNDVDLLSTSIDILF
ncbi:hypothetical protein [Teredinibacter haidensis]|uniref:hypothetical protein n=1 Tax=Teredinibacter haidensis TaxID=2731755 RepID=UPI000949050A|nr:hypothetical protein [Teredinibacter haidensis]